MHTEDGAARRLVSAVLQRQPVRTVFWIGAGLFSVALLSLGATPVAVDIVPPPWDKLLHFSVYGFIAALVALGLGGKRPWLAIALVIMLACLDEGMQIYEPGRHADVEDLIVDIVAAASVSALCTRLMRARI